MNTPTFNTNAFVKRITAAGMPERQAEVLAEALAERPRLATKSAVIESIEALARAVERRFVGLEAKIDERFAKVDEQFAKIDERFAKVDEQFAKIDGRFAKVDEQFAKVDGQFAKVDERFAKVDEQFAKIDQRFTGLEGMLARLLDGQAVLLQNDMELKRRLDEKK